MGAGAQTPNSEANSPDPKDPAGAASGADGQQQTPPETPITREALSKVQSRADKAEAALRTAQQAAEEARAARDQIDAQMRRVDRENKLVTLKPEERAAVIASFDLEDRQRELEENQRIVNAAAKQVTIDSLILTHGVKAEDLAGIDDVHEMRAHAAELKAARLEQELAEARAGAGQQKTPAAPAQPPAAMRQEPANAGAGGGGGYDASSFKNTGDLGAAIRARRAAGDFETEEIRVGGPADKRA